jgi:hypothetical protein
VGTFRVKSCHDCSVDYLHGLSIYPSPICVLVSELNSMMNTDPS